MVFFKFRNYESTECYMEWDWIQSVIFRRINCYNLKIYRMHRNKTHVYFNPVSISISGLYFWAVLNLSQLYNYVTSSKSQSEPSTYKMYAFHILTIFNLAIIFFVQWRRNVWLSMYCIESNIVTKRGMIHDTNLQIFNFF